MNDPRSRAEIPPTRADSDRGAMAQLVAHLLCKQGVRGSSPLGSTICPCQRHFIGRRSPQGAQVQQQSTATVAAAGVLVAFQPLTERPQCSQVQSLVTWN